MDPQDGLPADLIGLVHHHLTIEAPGAQQGRIEHFGPVGGGEDDNAAGGIETVHFHQELVEGLFPLVVGGEGSRTALADGIQFIDEDDAGRLVPGLFEEIPHPGGTHPHEHFHEVRAGHAEKGNPGLTGNGPGQEGFPRARGAHQQGAFGNLAADVGVFGGGFEKIDDFHQFILGLVASGDIHETGNQIALGHDLGVVLTEAHNVGTAESAHAAGHVTPYHQEQGNGDNHAQKEVQKVAVPLGNREEHHTALFQQGYKAGIVLNTFGFPSSRVAAFGGEDVLNIPGR